MREITEVHLIEISLVDHESLFPGCGVISVEVKDDQSGAV
jgi:hypothetical protein